MFGSRPWYVNAGTLILVLFFTAGTVFLGVWLRMRERTWSYRLAPVVETVTPQDADAEMAVLRRRVKAFASEFGARSTSVAAATRGEILLNVRSHVDPTPFVQWISQQGLLTFHLVGTEKDLVSNPKLWRRGQLMQKVFDLENIGQTTEMRKPMVIRRTSEFTVRSLKSVQYHTRGIMRDAIITLGFHPAEARAFERVTKANVGRPLALFIDGQARTVAKIGGPIEGGRVEVRGILLKEEARRLATLMRLGALPYPVKVSELRSDE